MKKTLSIGIVSLLVIGGFVGILSFVSENVTADIWSIEIIDSYGEVGGGTSIVLDSSDYPHISYYDATNDDLKYAKWTGGTWSIETVDSYGDIGRCGTSIALDSDNNPHISYDNFTNHNLKYAKWTGSIWSIETIDSYGIVGWFSSIAIDTNNHPHISYRGDTGPIKYAKWTDTTWSIETIDSYVDIGSTSIALDTNNQPHISYYDSINGDLKYARWTGSAWSIETIDSYGYVGDYTSIALDSNGYPHISYVDRGNRELKYARWTGSSWNIETVDTNDVCWETSIALDSYNHPHISYHDHINLDLKYAEWDGSAWNIETIDSYDYVGQCNSIALDSSNCPHISYMDRTNDNLKYAKIVSSSPTLSVSMNANPITINSGENSEITVHVTDDTNPISGASVSLTSDNGGTFTPQSGTTNSNGDFTSTFTAQSVSTQTVCTITAQALKTGYNSGQDQVQITVTAQLEHVRIYYDGESRSLFRVENPSIGFIFDPPCYNKPFYGEMHVKNNDPTTESITINSPSWVFFKESQFQVSAGEEYATNFILDVREDTPKTFNIKVSSTSGWEKEISMSLADSLTVINTDFDIRKDGYSFPNQCNSWGVGAYCYGMSGTSILYFEREMSLPSGVQNTYDLTWEDAFRKIFSYHYTQIGIQGHWALPNNYLDLISYTREGHPAVLSFGLQGHAVVAYKVIQYNLKDYICIYDSNYPFSFDMLYNAFRWGIYDENEKSFSYDQYTGFYAFRPAPLSILQEVGGVYGGTLCEFLQGCWNVFSGVVNVVVGGVYWLVDSVVSVFESPIDIEVSDQYDRKISYIDGTITNEIPNATMDLLGSVKVFYLPKNLDYNYEVVGMDDGKYSMTIFKVDLNESKAWGISISDVITSIDSKDIFKTTINFETITIQSVTQVKSYNLDIAYIESSVVSTFTHGGENIGKGSIHSYEVVSWDDLSDKNVDPIELSIDEDGDGTVDSTKYLHTDEGITETSTETSPLSHILNLLKDYFLIVCIIIGIILAITIVYSRKRKGAKR